LGAEITFVGQKGVSASRRYEADLGKNYTSQVVPVNCAPPSERMREDSNALHPSCTRMGMVI
jgi:hypothetical protein